MNKQTKKELLRIAKEMELTGKSPELLLSYVKENLENWASRLIEIVELTKGKR